MHSAVLEDAGRPPPTVTVDVMDHVGGRRGDRSIIGPVHERVLPHQPSHPFLRGADPLDPQLRPRFPVPFAMKR